MRRLGHETKFKTRNTKTKSRQLSKFNVRYLCICKKDTYFLLMKILTRETEGYLCGLVTIWRRKSSHLSCWCGRQNQTRQTRSFPLFRKHSQGIKQRNDAVNYYISRNSTELRDYHLIVGVVTCVAELVNNHFYRRIFCASYVSAEITFLSGIDLKEGSKFQF